ncbi:MAG: hypothetical protein AB9835_09200 [Eubacteriales bacterium]
MNIDPKDIKIDKSKVKNQKKPLQDSISNISLNKSKMLTICNESDQNIGIELSTDNEKKCDMIGHEKFSFKEKK